ncbi:unnamed protein product [Symbiodinium sp. KB8]|nr:unnamed protein product [Symbiodinium sp. KB8]
MEILWYGNSVSVLQLLDPSANVKVLAKSKEEALVVGRIRYGDAFPRVFNLECSEEGEATKLPELQSSKAAIAACVQNETDMATVIDIASKMDKIFAVVIAGPMVPDDIAHGEMTGKTSFIAMVRKADRAEKLQQLLEKSSKDHVGYENSVYNPQPGSPSSTLTPVLQQPGANAGKRRFIEDALTELRRKSGRGDIDTLKGALMSTTRKSQEQFERQAESLHKVRAEAEAVAVDVERVRRVNADRADRLSRYVDAALKDAGILKQGDGDARLVRDLKEQLAALQKDVAQQAQAFEHRSAELAEELRSKLQRGAESQKEEAKLFRREAEKVAQDSERRTVARQDELEGRLETYVRHFDNSINAVQAAVLRPWREPDPGLGSRYSSGTPSQAAALPLGRRPEAAVAVPALAQDGRGQDARNSQVTEQVMADLWRRLATSEVNR